MKAEILQGQSVVSQLSAAIAEIDEVGNRLNPDDKKEFTNCIGPHRMKAYEAIEKFNGFVKSSIELTIKSVNHHDDDLQEMQGNSDQPLGKELMQEQLSSEELELEYRRAQMETMETLDKDIKELHELFVDFSQQVHVRI